MNVSQISSLILKQVDDPTGTGFALAVEPNTAPPEVVAAINEGQALSALLTLCFEATASLTLTTSCFYQTRPALTDFLLPLRFALSGARIRPATTAEMESENPAWQATAGLPKRYACLGFNLLIVTPQQAGTAQMTYARTPTALVNDADVPELLEAWHQSLVDYGVYRLRLKEGAQGLERGLKRLNTYLDDMTKLGDYIRRRSAAARYDVEPFELQLFDRSRMISEVLKWQAKYRQPKS